MLVQVIVGWRKAGLLRAWDKEFQREAKRLLPTGKLFQLDTSSQPVYDYAPQGDEVGGGQEEPTGRRASSGGEGSRQGSDEDSSGLDSASDSDDDEGDSGAQEAALDAGAEPLVVRLLRRSARAATQRRRTWAELLHLSDGE